MKREKITEADLKGCILTLVEQLKDKNVNKIVTLSKGGYIPARLLAKYLNIRRIYSVGIEFYRAEGQTLEFPYIYQHLTEEFEDDDVILIIDDITDTGDSMKYAYSEVVENGGKNIITCSVLHKPKSSFTPNHYGKEVDNDTWIDFYFE